jgi:hypothetical protein
MVLAILFNEGCATTARYQAKVRSWQGQDAGSLVQAWGQPDDKQLVHGGNTMYVYARLHRMPIAYNDFENHYYAVNNARTPAQYSDVYIKCSTFFEVNPGNKIVATEFRGAECTSKD